MGIRIDWETVKSKTDDAYHIISIFIGIILGIAMIGQGSYMLYQGSDDGMEVLYCLGHAVMILGGIAVMVLSTKDRIKMTGAYALSLGLSRALLRCNDISATDNPRVIFVEIIFIILALNLVRIGFSYTKGKVVSQLSMIMTASILASTDLLLIIVDQYAEDLLSFVPLGIDSYFCMINALMYLALIFLLDTRIIRENTDYAKHAKVLDRIRSAYSLEKDSRITEETAKCLLERSGPLWRDIDDSTVQSEMAFTIVHDELKSTAIAQIWKGKDPLYVTVVNEGDSVFSANRFSIDELKESEGILYGYSKDGARFEVRIERRGSE